jgi:hypothetical protein
MPVAARQPLAPRMLALAALIAAAATLVAIALANAEPDRGARLSASPAGNPLGISNSRNGVAVLTAEEMLPGSFSSGMVTLTNTGSVDADFALEKAGLVDTPGPNGGLLSNALDLRVEELTGPTAKTVYAGKVGAMGRLGLGEFRKRTSRNYVFTVTMPDVGNAFQGSSLRLGFVWTETKASGNGPKGAAKGADGSAGAVYGSAGETGLEGGSQTGGSSSASGDDAGGATGGGPDGGYYGLAFTGFQLALIALAGAILLTLGTALRRRARRAR